MDPTNPAFRKIREKPISFFSRRRLVIIPGLPNARSGGANPDGWVYSVCGAYFLKYVCVFRKYGRRISYNVAEKSIPGDNKEGFFYLDFLNKFSLLMGTV
jgi:hypothetical protein